MNDLLEKYREVVGDNIIRQLEELSKPLKGAKVVHINSTREGGGVAEILHKLIPIMNILGIEAEWEIITGEPDFYVCTKMFHNGLQGYNEVPSKDLLNIYERTNEETAEKYRDLLREADFVFIHDPQPAALLSHFDNRKGKWTWRCHIDISLPNRYIWKYIRKWILEYDASIFSLPDFSKPLPHRQYIIPPSIDPLSDKNKALSSKEVLKVFRQFGFNSDLPMVLQVSRFDKFKDPIGVIKSYKLAKKLTPLQLVLAGGSATDDPEGGEVLERVQEEIKDDPDIFILDLPPDAHLTINALQTAADIVMQKSIREGFGLTVTEAMWKKKPVIGGNTGGIRLQVINHYTGFLVESPEGAALRLRYLLHHRSKLQQMGQRAHRFVKENFLLTRHLRDYLSLMTSMRNGQHERIQLYE